MARLLPVVAEEPGAGDFLDRDLGLAWSVCAHQGDVLTGPERACGEEDLPTRRDGDDDVGRQRILAGGRDDAARRLGHRRRARAVYVPDRERQTESGERPRRCRDRATAAERRRREHRRGAGSQRGHGAGVEHGNEHPRVGVVQHDEPGDRRQPDPRVARERRHPLQQRVSSADGGHRAEVPRGVVGHVQLRLHRPLAARVGDEPLAHGLVRLEGRDGALDIRTPEEGNAHVSFTAPISLTTESFALPNSIVVRGSRKSSLSMPAKPGAIERFITTTLAALSTSRMGIP